MAPTTDPYDFHRFVEAQSPVYAQVVAELRDGRKRSHWMWFIFPQIAGLGRSEMARRYAIASLAEAKAYLAHPLLGARLKECVRLVNAIEGKAIEEIFGDPDDVKFRSSMTLFARAAADGQIFQAALKKYFSGDEDAQTLALLEA